MSAYHTYHMVPLICWLLCKNNPGRFSQMYVKNKKSHQSLIPQNFIFRKYNRSKKILKRIRLLKIIPVQTNSLLTQSEQIHCKENNNLLTNKTACFNRQVLFYLRALQLMKYFRAEHNQESVHSLNIFPGQENTIVKLYVYIQQYRKEYNRKSSIK